MQTVITEIISDVHLTLINCRAKLMAERERQLAAGANPDSELMDAAIALDMTLTDASDEIITQACEMLKHTGSDAPTKEQAPANLN